MSKSEKAGKKGQGAKKDRGPKKARASAPALERSPSHLLHRVLQLALDIYADEAGDVGLTQRQYAVLAAAASAEHPTQTDLVRMTGIDRSTLADMAARMISKGLLARERSASDGRANVVRLTGEGRAALEAARPKVEKADARILSRLGSGKREPFLNALSKLARAGEGALAAEEEGEIVEAAPKAKKAKPRDGVAPKGAGGKSKVAKKAGKAKAEKGEAPFEPARLVAPE